MIYSSEDVLEILNNAHKDIDTAEDYDADSVHHFERILFKYSKKLHPQNFILIDIKMKLAQIYGNYSPYKLADLSKPFMERKIQVTNEQLIINYYGLKEYLASASIF